MDEALGKSCEPDQDLADDLAASILLVDDEPSNLKLLERTLEPCGRYSLVSATDPRSVVDLYQQHRFDLIILDLNMPYLDGFQVISLLRELKDAESLPPILVVTAQHDQKHRLRALQEGAADYVTKPFHMDELLARVA